MLKRIATACLLAGILLPLLTTVATMSRGLTLQSESGDAERTAQYIQGQMPLVLSIQAIGLLLIATGIVLLIVAFAHRRKGRQGRAVQ